MSTYIPEYFPDHDCIAKYNAGKIENVLAAVASRFIGAYPPQPPVYRVHSQNGFKRLRDCRYDMNLEERLPELEAGQFVYVWGKLWSDNEVEAPFSVSCYSPVKVYINGRLVFSSNLNDDVFPDRRTFFRAGMDKGWNHLVLEYAATGTGCGGIFGTGSVKGAPVHFLTPTAQSSGCEGWIYSGPQQTSWAAWLEAEFTEEQMTARCAWFPTQQWSPQEQAYGNCSRIFGEMPGATAFAWSKLEVKSLQREDIRLLGSYRGMAEISIYVNGELVAEHQNVNGTLDIQLVLGYGLHELVVESICGEENWGFELDVRSGGILSSLVQPYPVEGLTDPWLYLGLLTSETAPKVLELTAMDTLFGEADEATFWRVDQPNSWVRPYLESVMFGRWNYPLGVTLYGLLRTGVELKAPHYAEYAQHHIEQCTVLHEYALWDLDRYGAPGINHQLALMDSLDDCGSFGATMLEAHKLCPLQGATHAAAEIANYITEVQSRLPDGALYRTTGTVDFMQQTMWCDDLYMSTPFLSKYYELTGNAAYLDDAAAQFLLYKERLFQPELGIMHHVYDYKFNKPNGVPWGRGNGWVIFSLTELLEVMPEHHPLRSDLLDYFRELSKGYLKLQDERGLWHQVLTDLESYAEASCTSMFIYAFTRGVRCGWLPEPEPYVTSAISGWSGLTHHCIDKQGNVYGVCRGSGYSFNKLYYKDELTWQLNDTHGIGIVLLAGIEVHRLVRDLEMKSHNEAK
ncbi:glycoside hydrolase family 88/105 protein [Paenibacillus borealis]|uniref:glycoside hydrolase family 88/105 protein n=1 Tax=Paenibacillus borealis TaxID=160799 RepID=UPI0015C2F599|nr:glycoside hydrolase family 88 protein [Paenibacillus borealis]